jgi:hypothetical protein
MRVDDHQTRAARQQNPDSQETKATNTESSERCLKRVLKFRLFLHFNHSINTFCVKHAHLRNFSMELIGEGKAKGKQRARGCSHQGGN